MQCCVLSGRRRACIDPMWASEVALHWVEGPREIGVQSHARHACSPVLVGHEPFARCSRAQWATAHCC